MQLLLSGPLVSKAFRAVAERDDESVDEVWLCYVCGTKNSDADIEEGVETEGCTRCNRRRYPPWLLVENANIQLGLGSCIRQLDDANFGTKVGVVSGIDFFNRRVQVLSVCSKVPYQSSTTEKIQEDTNGSNGRRSKFIFDLSELDQAQIQQLRPIATDDEVANELLNVLKHQGLCGDCRHVFRIAQGNIGEEEASREAIRALVKERDKWIEIKTQNSKLKENDRVLECTHQIKTLGLQLSKIRRNVEFLRPLCCPHCGYNAS